MLKYFFLYKAKNQLLPFFLNNPLSRFPQGGKALLSAPSPLEEGWEGGINK
jgi:hypothetical protein